MSGTEPHLVGEEAAVVAGGRIAEQLKREERSLDLVGVEVHAGVEEGRADRLDAIGEAPAAKLEGVVAGVVGGQAHDGRKCTPPWRCFADRAEIDRP